RVGKSLTSVHGAITSHAEPGGVAHGCRRHAPRVGRLSRCRDSLSHGAGCVLLRFDAVPYSRRLQRTDRFAQRHPNQLDHCDARGDAYRRAPLVGLCAAAEQPDLVPQGREPLHVLRRVVPNLGAHPRPHHADQPRRPRLLDERRHRMPPLQQPQGRPHAGAGRHAARRRAVHADVCGVHLPEGAPRAGGPDGVSAHALPAVESAARASARGSRARRGAALSRRRTAAHRRVAMPADELISALRRFGIDVLDRPGRAVGGGSISRTERLETSGGPILLKLEPRGAADRLEAEAEGLDALRASRAVAVPEVLARGTAGAHAFLALEWIEAGATPPAAARRLGTALAQLHRRPSDASGWHRDNYVGRTPQPNGELSSWPEFSRERRRAWQLSLGRRNGLGTKTLALGDSLL